MIAKPFAVAKLELTFAEWDACAAHGNCDAHVSDGGFGRNGQPVINVTWDDAQRFVTLLLELRKAAKLHTRTPFRLCTTQARPLQIVSAMLDVRAKLILDFAVDAGALKQSGNKGTKRD